MINTAMLLTSLSALERFTNDSLKLKHHSGYLGEFHFNRELLRAAMANTYLETVGNRSDSIHLAIERYPAKDTITGIGDSLFSRISSLSRKSISSNTDPVMIAFDYTHEDFYGDRDTLWIHGWTGDHGVTGKYSYLTASIVNRDLRLPIMSIPSPMGNDMPSEISAMLVSLGQIFGHIDLLLFDRGFYSKDLIMKLNNVGINYLIFVPKNPQVKGELSFMHQSEKRIMLHEFSLYRDGKKVSDSVHLAFLKQIFDHRTEAYYDWCFATSIAEPDLDHLIAKYKFRWRIETMFRVQDECRLKTESKDIRVRYFLFAYEQLVESIWYLFYHKEVSFKRYLIELSEACTVMVNNVERKERTRKQP
ncbi:transposase IS4 family protein [mine drainage metagenome]|uniref:Transposase IS4 family protein n=1 Tax=mine drainage metagenome TaxID=410659 RepID=T1B4R4_9ZZZZ